MTRDHVLDVCSKLPNAVEDYPFGDDVAGFKVGGKMFALVMITDEPGSVNLKCAPDCALELRAMHAGVRPGYHQNKRHWNTVDLDGTIDDTDLQEMIDHTPTNSSSAACPAANGTASSDVDAPSNCHGMDVATA